MPARRRNASTAAQATSDASASGPQRDQAGSFSSMSAPSLSAASALEPGGARRGEVLTRRPVLIAHQGAEEGEVLGGDPAGRERPKPVGAVLEELRRSISERHAARARGGRDVAAARASKARRAIAPAVAPLCRRGLARRPSRMHQRRGERHAVRRRAAPRPARPGRAAAPPSDRRAPHGRCTAGGARAGSAALPPAPARTRRKPPGDSVTRACSIAAMSKPERTHPDRNPLSRGHQACPASLPPVL